MQIIKSEITFLLKEDKAFQDITTNSIIVQNTMHTFKVTSKQALPFVLCGVEAMSQALAVVLAKNEITYSASNGQVIHHGDVVISGKASIKELLQVERCVLNLIQHLSGIATKTQEFINTLDDKRIKILDTRKTMPYLRRLQKYAVKVGGGFNHRMNLAEMAMIKDNHIVAANGSIYDAVRLVRKNTPNVKIEVECDNITQVEETSTCGVDIILLDNMTIDKIKVASKIIRNNSSSYIEVSGGITLKTIAQYKGLDIDYISIGNLTHSVDAVDISLEVL
ncbi:MAG: nicotinate-nucleotide pyrophosphorylase (carboxylating) [Candidatus Deianiraeaceae bacterium]|jgi:nicotinate-nucleotide pyrophosphorylase (carboxylating)